jgi:sulfoxide reductase heme-binding subunit YedZ
VAENGAARVRLLREREPERRSSTLEPGAREAAAELRSEPQDGDVQRLRRAGRPHVQGHGPAQELLKPITVVKVLCFAAALIPAAALAKGLYAALVLGDPNALTANPGDYITDQTGTWTITFLTIALSITPLRRITGANELVKIRRMFGLFAFFYATLHLSTWIVFVNYFDIPSMIVDIGKRPFITVGMATFVILFLLALTSNRFAMRKLGRRWQKLHRLVYVAGILAVVHFWWLVKADITEPRRWALAIGSLLLFRVWWANRDRLSLRS